MIALECKPVSHVIIAHFLPDCSIFLKNGASTPLEKSGNIDNPFFSKRLIMQPRAKRSSSGETFGSSRAKY
jgi:hypothetical protein